jgi:hypothetical protein
MPSPRFRVVKARKPDEKKPGLLTAVKRVITVIGKNEPDRHNLLHRLSYVEGKLARAAPDSAEKKELGREIVGLKAQLSRLQKKKRAA